MKFLLFFSLILVLIFFHELGHYLCAKILRIPIEKIGFTFKPFPRFYISVFDVNLSKPKQILYLCSGNFMTITIYIVLLCINLDFRLIYAACIAQIVTEFNPFLSDYQIILFNHFKKKEIQECVINNLYNLEERDASIKALYNESYMLSMPWSIHFVVWGVCSAVMLKYLLIPNL